MSTDKATKKRKSGDDVVPAAKKAKTAPPKSADKPAPLKSALKKGKSEKETKPKEKKSKASKKAEPVEEAQDDEEEEEFTGLPSDTERGAELTADQTDALLAGFSSSEDEGSEDENEQDDGIDISKLPAAPKPKQITDNKQKEEDPERTPGVIYLGRIPHGFHEPQMRAYFSQFGTITRLRLARNKKTGKSQHYAFIEFSSASVADIVARTMDKYLLFGHILQVRTVPKEQVKDGMFKIPKGMKKNGKVRPRNKLEGTGLRKGNDREGWERRVVKEGKRRGEKADKLKEMGYEFEMPGLKDVKEVESGAEGGVKLIEGKKSEVEPGVEEEVETKVAVDEDKKKVVKEKTVKRKSKESGTTSVSVTKKRKTKTA